MISLVAAIMYVIVLRLLWIIAFRPVGFFLFTKITGKRIEGKYPGEIREQKKEIEKYYRMTVDALGEKLVAYGNPDMDNGLAAEAKNGIRLFFDYSTFRAERKRRKEVYTVMAFFENKTGKNGAIRWEAPEASRKLGEPIIINSPNLENELRRIKPVLEELVFKKNRDSLMRM
ncbi:TPA: hypothetical protein EYP38_01540 [Candidatus Micrarchaeota archaeon]|nr:hypothetical protein [Candidatus Micrarchaeota archaeon]